MARTPSWAINASPKAAIAAHETEPANGTISKGGIVSATSMQAAAKARSAPPVASQVTRGFTTLAHRTHHGTYRPAHSRKRYFDRAAPSTAVIASLKLRSRSSLSAGSWRVRSPAAQISRA